MTNTERDERFVRVMAAVRILIEDAIARGDKTAEEKWRKELSVFLRDNR